MKKMYPLFAGLTLAATLVAACGPAATPTPAATEVQATAVPATAVPTAVPATAVPPTETAVPMPTLGTEEHPIIMALAPSATTDELVASGDTIAKLISEETGLVVKAVVPTNYKAMIEAMCSGNSQVGFLPPFAYLVAHQTMSTMDGKEVACADVTHITIRSGADHYATQYIGRADVFTTVVDATDIANLQLLNKKKPCWTDQFSASGYVIPASLLASEGVKPATAAFVQGHPTVVRAVYAGGICDFGATFVDARTNSAIQTDLPDVMEKVIVIYQTEAIIPNDTLAMAYDVSPELRATLVAAFDKVSMTEEGAAALKKLYSIDGLQATEDTFFDEFRVLLAASGIDIASLVR